MFPMSQLVMEVTKFFSDSNKLNFGIPVLNLDCFLASQLRSIRLKDIGWTLFCCFVLLVMGLSWDLKAHTPISNTILRLLEFYLRKK